MADCPNCGRQTLRTKDWVCQWCGYPLVTKSYKSIDKTFKELQEERNLALKSNDSKNELEFFTEEEPEVKPEPPARNVAPPRAQPVPPPPPRPAPPAPEPVASPSLPLQPVAPAPPPAAPAPPQAQPSSEPPPVAEPVMPSPPVPPAATAPQSPPDQPSPVPPAPPPPPEPSLKLEDIKDGMEITAEQIDALFNRDKDAANSCFTGKTLIIKGIVDKIFIRDHLDIRYIMLVDAKRSMTWNLRCTFNKEEASKLSRLQEGQAIAVGGKYEGVSKNIIFKDCILG